MKPADSAKTDIAIVGMAGRFPRARTVEEYWRNLREGVEAISFFSEEELIASGVDRGILQDPTYVRARGVLDDIDLFDAPLFGFTPKEAAVTDPQQRVFLECAWEALERAGYDSTRYDGRIGVFAGASIPSYLLHNLHGNDAVHDLLATVRLGNRLDNLATRVSYKLNLRGPSVNVQTSCSTSLVAVHLACQALLNGECDMALAGGVAIYVPQKTVCRYQEGGIASPDGHCRAFDASAEGTVGGNGVGIVVLKHLARALADRDHVHAVIKGSAINNDGSEKIGYTAPSVDGQAEVIAEALGIAGIPPETVSYVEAHGTGTPLGDPIEMAALTQVFAGATTARRFCAIGAVKTNIGHLDTAAGIAGLIKTVLALEHRKLPPTLHYRSANPRIDFETGPFYVNAALSEWKRNGTPRRAGVSSFGIGGTNAHVVVEEAPLREPIASRRAFHLLTLSARTDDAVRQTSANLARHVEQYPDLDLGDVAFTLRSGRRVLERRRAVVCRDRAEALAALDAAEGRDVFSGAPTATERPIVLMFPGQGSQHAGMGLDLYRHEPRFREHVDRCSELLAPHLGLDLRDVLYPERNDPAGNDPRLDQTAITQPALFVVEYGVAQLWRDSGVEAEAMIGHSIGEYVAACLARVLSLEDALALVAERGRLMQQTQPGMMLAIPVAENLLPPILDADPHVSLAAVNAPERCVVSGPPDAIERVARRCADRGISVRRLATSHAFHSSLMDPVLGPFEARIRAVALHPPKVPYISNVTGTWITPADATDPAYWVRHVRQPVRFAEGICTLATDASRLFLDVGPGQTLKALAAQQLSGGPARTVASLRHATDLDVDRRHLTRALAQIWVAGGRVDWNRYYADDPRARVVLPTYPFERQRHWIDPDAAPGRAETGPPAEHPAPADPDSAMKTATPATVTDGGNGRDRVLSGLIDLVKDLSGVAADAHATFFEMGFDSLALMQICQGIQRRYGVPVAFRQLFEDLPCLDAVAWHISERVEVPPDPAAADAAPASSSHPNTGDSEAATPPLRAAAPTEAAAADRPAAATSLERIVAQQLQIMATQLEVLRTGADGTRAPGGDPSAHEAFPRRGEAVASPPARPSVPGGAAEPSALGATPQATDGFGPWKPVKRLSSIADLDARQQAHLESLVGRYTSRTPRSKQLAERYRPVLADTRMSLGFHPLWKEMVYPIVASRSSGSRIWDVDGNEYVDAVMGFGVNLFGHSPAFITERIAEQLARGVHIGPQSDLVGQVAELFCELTGMERATFCNTGSEAVLGALRLARTVTGRVKVAGFAGSYHGISDNLVMRPHIAGGRGRSAPAAPGIPASMVQDMLVLNYNDPESLEIIEAHAGELAAVLVEPIQSRRPDVQPRDFLHALRRLTERAGIVLIFDEMISGFRLDPRGAQGWFDVRPDLATYGKVVGGGMPIGVIGGTASCMDAVDGGQWSYGDDSYPAVNQTFFAGTFCKHPLAMAGALAALEHLRASGPRLQQGLNDRTSALVSSLVRDFERGGIPLSIQHCGSLFRFAFTREMPGANLFFYHLRDHGLHTWEGRTCFLSTAHTEEDVERMADAIHASAAAMEEGGFFPERPHERPAATTQAVAVDTTVPLTDAQKSVWMMTQVGEDASRAYNESQGLRIRGSLDVEALRRAIQALVDRHEALRTTFSPDGTQQTVHARMLLEVPLTDVTTLGADEREAEMQRWLAREAQELFDLAGGAPIRFRILRLAADDHLVIRTIHHLVTDGWSSSILLGDLKALYLAESRRRPCDLPPPARYSEFVRQGRRQPDSGVPVDAERYWIEQFDDLVPVLDLPTDRPRPPVQTFRGARESLAIHLPAPAALTALSARYGCSAYMTLLAAFGVLLHRLSGQSDITIGMPAAEREESARRLVGYCMTMLPLRSRLTWNAPFTAYLRDIRRAVLDAQQRQDCSLARLAERLAVPRDLSRPLFVSTIFNVDKGGAEFRIGDLDVEIVANPNGSVKTELDANVRDMGDRLLLEWDYNTDLFDRATVRRWMQHYACVLSAIVDNPEQPIARIELLTADERDRLVRTWNATEAPYPHGTCLHELIQAQVSRTPDGLAVTAENGRLTYRELNRQANRIADHLRTLGVKPDRAVGVCMERSLEMVTGLLGILKAGAAYLPLDPTYPPDRLAFMIDDADCAATLTQERFADILPSNRTRLVLLDKEDAIPESASAENPPNDASPDSLAYMIYTSGSTGRPKGAMTSHDAIVNRLHWMQQVYGLTPEDRVLQKTPFGFDVSIWEFFWPLMTGARLVMARPGGHQDPAYVAGAIGEEEITTVHFVPSMLAAVLEEARFTECPALRRVICSGEALPVALQQRFFERSQAELWNLYGPTEAAVDVTFWKCVPDGPPRTVPIGRPIANTHIHLLDECGQTAPVGVAGELHIGGAGLARGYLKRPDLTAEKFVPDPFAGRAGARLYRTGDLARYLPDGSIEFLGRIDHQIKIRGVRIELGEIESVLAQQPGVGECVVVSHDVSPRDTRLVAYIVPAGDASPAAAMLVRQLKERLPDAMIPSAFVMLDGLPHTSSGKVNRRALPPPVWGDAAGTARATPPATALEQTLAAMWSEILDVSSVGLEDDFFDLGGHSLSAVRVLARVREIFGVSLTLGAFFEARTLRAFSAAVARGDSQPGRADKIAAALRALDEPDPEDGRLDARRTATPTPGLSA